jgi:hypothetical protein
VAGTRGTCNHEGLRVTVNEPSRNIKLSTYVSVVLTDVSLTVHCRLVHVRVDWWACGCCHLLLFIFVNNLKDGILLFDICAI